MLDHKTTSFTSPDPTLTPRVRGLIHYPLEYINQEYRQTDQTGEESTLRWSPATFMRLSSVMKPTFDDRGNVVMTTPTLPSNNLAASRYKTPLFVIQLLVLVGRDDHQSQALPNFSCQPA